MRLHSFLLLHLSGLAVASPMPWPQGTGSGADSCASSPLTPQTWTDLKLDDFLASTAKNYTRTKSNNVQSLAASFGAPNFFCGLDKFCNAGQPCLPIQVPAWYAAIAIQNWNNYMNGLNTAISFASSILSLKLGEIINDVYKDPQDNITPLKNIASMFTAVLGVIPFTGAVATVAGGINSGLGFVIKHATPPAPVDKFMAWSNVGSSLGDVLQDYQAAVSNGIDAILDAEIDNPDNGINSILKGGGFLGVSQNFTQADIQNLVINSITMNALGLALQAQKTFITRFFNTQSCEEESSGDLCRQNEGSSTFTKWTMLRANSKDLPSTPTDATDALTGKYGMTKEQMLKGVTDCYDNNGKKQLTNPFDQGGLPADPNAPCVFNLLVCDIDVATNPNKGVMDDCRDSGVPL